MELTIKDFKELIGNNRNTEGKREHPYYINENYLIRTVTMIYTGKLKAVFDKELVLTNAAWIADTGRFSENLESCSFEEVEMYPSDKEVVVGRGAIVDAVVIRKLPTETK